MASERSDICRFNMASGHSDMFFSNLRFRLKNQTVVRQSILLCIYFDLRLLCRKLKSEGTSHLVLNARALWNLIAKASAVHSLLLTFAGTTLY